MVSAARVGFKSFILGADAAGHGLSLASPLVLMRRADSAAWDGLVAAGHDRPLGQTLFLPVDSAAGLPVA